MRSADSIRRRRLLLAGAAIAVLAGPGWAQGRPVRIGWLATGTSDVDDGTLEVFKRALAQRGYAEGVGVNYDVRSPGADLGRLDLLASELVQNRPDVRIGNTTPIVAALQRATRTIPIVMLSVSDPIGAGFAASLSRPGGNITGVTDLGLDLTAKGLELLRMVVPQHLRIGVLMSDKPPHPAQFAVLSTAAKAAGIPVQALVANSSEDVEAVFATLARKNVNAIVLLGGAPQRNMRRRIGTLAIQAKTPTLSISRLYVVDGALLSYGATYRIGLDIVADYVDRILHGANPATLPMQQPTKLELAVNARTARALGITLPAELMLRADEVIE